LNQQNTKYDDDEEVAQSTACTAAFCKETCFEQKGLYKPYRQNELHVVFSNLGPCSRLLCVPMLPKVGQRRGPAGSDAQLPLVRTDLARAALLQEMRKLAR
jgi:hypothetical protein